MNHGSGGGDDPKIARPARRFVPPVQFPCEQLPVAMLGHPVSAREMALKSPPSAIWFNMRIAMQHNPRDVLPISTIRLSVEQPQIRDKVFVVIGGQKA